MLNSVLVVAAGRGHRMGGEIPKQFVPLGGVCALRRAVDVFLALEAINLLRVVIHPDDASLCQAALAGIDDERLLLPVHGGSTRAASVRLGLESFREFSPHNILIHDAARPFIPADVILAVLAALDKHEGALAALPVVDALWSAEASKAATPVSREGLWRAQTPQGFRFTSILAAHRAHDGEAHDDVAVARAAGIAVQIVAGSEANFKITTAADFERAQVELIRLGCT
ncbi:2-C-methyl-D-erythritol 4-phosphate cytidylyltransferase [Hoeflea sp. YIM 152468]|uniref:2-C-methyl-D-erythritol 4-phosphate cytidylyltransferase n=1 Tax=Hoeflea sp. YIM 152468 TaxID=3031759 RepID=UPI0023DBB7D6|nr:2-C-methyl-D-erythritol 4-phosphate cytidylyltransferase [Hoeflea sp. YIM 152468]MDF1606900.1 2-C-methyl-D-erythritol 4-phosphate cytidylyltransferase [Hoeflea sp. YIM 152468]